MALVQFKEVALLGPNQTQVKLSPFSEGIEGASKSILVTEVNEEAKIEDDQTVFSRVTNTITIVAPVLDSQIATINTWMENHSSVAFAGYTIGGLVYGPSVSAEEVLYYDNVLKADYSGFGGSRDDGFKISEITQVDQLKHTFRIVMTQECMQGRSARGLLYGVQPNVNLLETATISKRITASGGTDLPWPWQLWAETSTTLQELSITPTGNAFNIVYTGTGSVNAKTVIFFPFNGQRGLLLEATGRGNNDFTSITYSKLNSTGGVLSSSTIALTSSVVPAYVSASFSAGDENMSYIQLDFGKPSNSLSATMRLDDISIRVV